MKTPEESKLRMVSFVTHATRGVMRDRAVRRRMMTAVVVLAVAMLIAGSTFLREPLDHREHLGRFVFFWLVCAWLTMTALLLALFDLLLVRAQAQAAGRRVREELSSSRSDAADK